MSNILIFDTETTGIPFYGSEHPADAPYQPRICSIAMALLDEGGAEIHRLSALVSPEGWPLDDARFMDNFAQAEKIHGLSLDRLKAEGRPIEVLHAAWSAMYSQADFTCGYNVAFDHKIARGEWKRLGFPIPFRDKQWIDLMKPARPLCGLGKMPKLSDAVRILLGREHVGAHDAVADLDATIDLYRYMKPLGVLVAEDQPEAKVKAA